MPVRISLFTSDRHWWRGPQRNAGRTATDIFPLGAKFKAGRATLLTAGDHLVTGLARGSRRGSASDFHGRVSFDHISEIPPIPLDDLEKAIKPRSRGPAAHIFAQGFGILTEAVSADLREWIRRNHTLASSQLEELLACEPRWMERDSDVAAQFRDERDAVNMALEAAGMDRRQALAGVDMPTEPEHFSVGGTVEVTEDPTVADDIRVFPGWDRMKELRPQGNVYKDPASGRKLTVLLANKTAIETSIGVDLLYHVHDYGSFVFVQYKRVRREGGRRVVRLDKQLDAELTRMLQLEKALANSARTAATLQDYRLSNGTCFFKLTESDQPSEITDLSRGKYVSLASWNLMNQAGLMVGRKGGRSLDYDEVKRYHSNSSFAELVSEGWVGSTTSQFDSLLDLAFENHEAGRTLVMGDLEMGSTYRRISHETQKLEIHPVHVETSAPEQLQLLTTDAISDP